MSKFNVKASFQMTVHPTQADMEHLRGAFPKATFNTKVGDGGTSLLDVTIQVDGDFPNNARAEGLAISLCQNVLSEKLGPLTLLDGEATPIKAQ